MPELQVRVPYSAWGAGTEWHEGYEDLLTDFARALEAAGAGDVDEPDHFEDFICFYLDGDDLEELRRVARQVLDARGMASVASGFVADPAAGDWRVGTPVDL